MPILPAAQATCCTTNFSATPKSEDTVFVHPNNLFEAHKNMSYKSLLVTKIITYFKSQCAKKFVSNSLRLVDCAIGLVNTVLNWPAGQVKFFGEFKLQKNCIQSCSSNTFFRAVKETLRLVHARYSLPKWQTVKLTFFTPWVPLQIGGKSLIIQKWIKSPIKNFAGLSFRIL